MSDGDLVAFCKTLEHFVDLLTADVPFLEPSIGLGESKERLSRYCQKLHEDIATLGQTGDRRKARMDLMALKLEILGFEAPAAERHITNRTAHLDLLRVRAQHRAHHSAVLTSRLLLLSR